jgi:inhibitor of KinA
MDVTPLGDSALIVRMSEKFAGEDSLNAVLAAHRCLEAAQLPAVVDLAPAYTTIGVFFDPVAAVESGAPVSDVVGWYEQRIRQALANADEIHVEQAKPRKIDIPVCYDSEFGFDLDEVARRAGLSTQEVINFHSGANYRVHCVGFTPGFPFLGGLPEKLATPRRPTPRKEIPAGSVAIGGEQTGIYPVKSPGGWNVIGRTPRQLFDHKKDPPALLQAGDRIRFHQITRDEFEALHSG